MKKLLAAILLMMYFCVSTGFVVSMHFCMNRYDSAQLGAAESDQCNKCGMHKADSDGCCRDEVKVLKLQVDPLVAKALAPNFSIAVADVPLPLHLATPFYNFSKEDDYTHFRPPLLSESDTYLSNRVFRL